MKWTIDKSFDWCYGHRVWSQQLNAEFTAAGDTCLACRHLHGHQGKLKVLLEGEELERGMVTDFKHLGWMKDFIDDTLDHKFIMDISDPIIAHELPHYSTGGTLNFDMMNHDDRGYWTLDLTQLPSDIVQGIYEKYEGIVLVDFIPTSENLSAWLLEVAREKMSKLGVDVVAVDFWETPKSHCRVEV